MSSPLACPARPQALEVLRRAGAVALADLAVTYTWRTWLFGRVPRKLSQVAFFALIGRVVGGEDAERFLVVGNALMACAVETTLVVASSAWERALGTMPLLVSAPAPLAWAFAVRSAQWIISGTGASLVALLLLGPLFGADWQLEMIPVMVLLVVLTAVGTYCFGLALGAWVIDHPAQRNVVSLLANLLMMTICGVQVALDHWPAPVQTLAALLPITHELVALRELLDGAPLSAILPDAAAGALVGAAWLAIAVVAFGRVGERGRRDGTIEFGA
ncbi:ABC transporter permease [Streptomyces cavernae]|uniref:ABC transporter permease n=1 Tax=Streptomyces cavernae TaxID=2259034 RepID=UPI000FEBD987|nr:ABC transporter permease [Streptomyces cavernae]